ncbi:MAG: hypothetical protein A2898_00650 [Candidatus Kerfeldbacteria bacterium RIFCSPLOWO2_01_FULL_48_11]|uniref:Uncharacterized protein n=1 Tax=Candidatus Kerfeldbacteria bacterium RIFCSPLOWO2_01_FULL_48_11 TaxID=1798543 RepID=A0A1G2B475_9BACT|nr:MAG: hypothetical protein UY52_C0011G0017 [Parcubacteria group bacterium GW2011_GWC2_49_9]OGY83017.1 MAG: hypothetical protein A2898_00650 [Candidatus Kerfeldbacteria bacterium RIFCSPLOWO2_01_FULL_48_11]
MTEKTPAILKAQALIEDALRRRNLPDGPGVATLDYMGEELARRFANAVALDVKRMTTIIKKRVRVDRSRTPKEMLSAARYFHLTIDVPTVENGLTRNCTGDGRWRSDEMPIDMPRGTGEEVEVHFFYPGINCSDPPHEYERRNLEPADPYSLIQANTDDWTFSSKHPNCTFWHNIDERVKNDYPIWITFLRSSREGRATISRWSRRGRLWFAGVPKK